MLKSIASLLHFSEGLISTHVTQLLICAIGGLLCLLPLILSPRSRVEMSLLRASSPSQLHKDSATAVITLIVPLLLDITTDLLNSCFTKAKKMEVKNHGKQTLLNNMEHLLFLCGTFVVPITGYLEPYTEKWAFIYVCCRQCQFSLSGGAVLISLCRYNVEYWPVRTTNLILALLLTGSIIGAFTSNNGTRNQATAIYRSLELSSYYIILSAGLLFAYCSMRWLSMSVPKWIKRWNLFLKVLPEDIPKEGRSTGSDIKESLLYPILYVMLSLMAVFFLFLMSNLYAGPLNFDAQALFFHNLAFILYLLIITYGSMRMMKREIVQGLYALIESKKMYVRYISHELRTPLNSACLGLKLVSDDLEGKTDYKGGDHFEILSDVKAACRTAVQILDDLLCFDKLENGMLKMHKHEVPVMPFITDCVGMFTSQAKEAGVTLSLLFGQKEALPAILQRDTVYMDKFKMDQVLRNLISNALKFTPRGGSVSVSASFVPNDGGTTLPKWKVANFFNIWPRWTSKVRSSDHHDIEQGQSASTGHLNIHNTCPRGDSSDVINGKLVITVTDTGAGISLVNQRRLFHEIVQFNPEVLQAGGGSGLGLWITNSLVDMHNGTIRVQSSGEGMGSSFTAEIEMQRRCTYNTCEHPEISVLACETRDSESSQIFRVTDQRKFQSNLAIVSTLDAPAIAMSKSLSTECFSKKTEWQECPSLEKEEKAHGKTRIVEGTLALDILVVDDSDLNRKMLCRVLRTSGHHCDEADDGLSAVEKVKMKMSSECENVDKERRQYDVILMDFVMPNMDGPTATKAIRDIGYSGYIFGVTGNALDSDISFFISHGANHVLTKPFDYSRFLSLMSRNSRDNRREFVCS